MTTTIALAELDELVGKPLPPGEWVTVDQKRIDTFADAADDPQWIHTDPGRAAAGPYGATIAHGYLTLSLLPHFGRELFAFDFGSARVNYGVNKVRFPAPVPVGSALRATVTFTDIDENPAGHVISARYVVESGAVKPACVAETLVLVVR